MNFLTSKFDLVPALRKALLGHHDLHTEPKLLTWHSELPWLPRPPAAFSPTAHPAFEARGCYRHLSRPPCFLSWGQVAERTPPLYLPRQSAKPGWSLTPTYVQPPVMASRPSQAQSAATSLLPRGTVSPKWLSMDFPPSHWSSGS